MFNLLVAGVHLDSSGYPNVKYRLQALREDAFINVKEINFSVWDSERSSKFSVLSFLRVFLSHFYVFFKSFIYLFRFNFDAIYVPYPSIFTVFIFRFLFGKTRLISDGFISLYDTIVIDRKYVSRSHVLAKVLFLFERLSFNSCSIILVDTEENAKYFSCLFGISASRFISAPLFTNENISFMPGKNDLKENAFNVLFVGNMIPLHGVSVILEAASKLKHKKEIHFTLVGSGQESHLVSDYMDKGFDNVTWIPEWQSESVIASLIVSADVCLGVFSENEKANRVCPYKIYFYSMLGASILTARTDCLSRMSKGELIFIPPGSPFLLAEKILSMYENKSYFKCYKDLSAKFYRRCLRNGLAYSEFKRILFG